MSDQTATDPARNAPQRAEKALLQPALHLLILEDNPVIAWQLAADLTALGQIVCGPFATLDAVWSYEGPLDGAIVDISIGSEVSFAFVSGLLDQGHAVVLYSGSASDPVAGGLSQVPRYTKPTPTGRLLEVIRSQLKARRGAGDDVLDRLVRWRGIAREICGDDALADRLLEIALERAITHYETAGRSGADPDLWLQAELQHLSRWWRSRRLI